MMMILMKAGGLHADFGDVGGEDAHEITCVSQLADNPSPIPSTLESRPLPLHHLRHPIRLCILIR